ncbi:MAG: hypothetical protein ACYDC5_02730 [Candidatus Dormibacteria bacterium]
MKDLLGRIVGPTVDPWLEHQRGSLEYLGHLARSIAVIPTSGADRIVRQGNEVHVWLSTAALKGLIEGCDEAVCQVIVLEAPGGRPRITVIGERDGHHAACIGWSALPKGPSKY